jgi:transcriptional regulator with XRE-family HTH domain
MPRLFGEKVRALRRQRDMTQVELARKIGLAAHTHITKLEAGQDAPSLDLVLRIAAVFRVTTDHLLRDTIALEEPAATTGELREGLPELFGRKLHTLRRRQGLSQNDLARQLGLARRGYISNLETGRKKPSLDLVVQVADLFGVTTDYLLRDPIPPKDRGSGTAD